ncbi:Photoreceptor dehydrogenase [Carabus blaptoides fortunei]
MELTGKIALVTGGATGIGFEYCKHLLHYGIQKVCIVDKEQKKGETALNQINHEFGKDRAMFIKADVTKNSDLEAAFETVISAWKTLDIVINNAGIMDDLHWELEIAVNFNAVVQGSLLAFKFMSKSNGGNGGVLVNIASILGMEIMASIPVYVGTKHAVVGLSRSLGMPFNYEMSGIRVLTMCPGVTITPLITEAHNLASTVDKAAQVRKELDILPTQNPADVAKGMMHLIKHGGSGSVWVCEGGEPIYEVVIPEYPTLRKK